MVDDAGSIIASLSELDAVKAGGFECEETVRAVADIDRRFMNLGVISASGVVTCSAVAVPEGTNLSDRTYFLDAMRYDDLAWGAYQIGRITGQPSINVGYPIRNALGRPIGVMFGAVSVEFLGAQLATVELPPGAAAMVVDGSGTILVDTAHPARIGDPASRISLSTLYQDPSLALSGFFDGEVIASVRQLTGGAVLVAIPRSVVEAPAIAEARNVLFVGIAAALLGGGVAFLLTWAGVARPITRIRSIVRELAGGDLTQRLRPRSSTGTLNGLAWDIDEMAAALATSEAELRRFAFEDRLTALPNRSALLLRLQFYPEGALVYLRVESLADVSALLGYEAADEVMLAVARRVADEAEDTQLIGRVSESAFAVFFPSATNRESARARMSRLLSALQGGVRIGDATIELIVRVGAALAPSDADEPETLMRRAELAARGANRSDFGTLFDAAADEQKAENLRLLNEMREALLADAFDMVYQPIVSLRGHGDTHFEALIRWTGGDGLTRSPAEFIPLAERTGAIEHVDRWVIDRVGRQLEAWRREGFRPCVSVNLSAHSLLNEDLPAYVENVLTLYGVGDHQLQIEITETAFIEGMEGPLRVCEALNAMGVSLSVDDFGMGYSPVQYLRTFPAAILKLDVSVIRDLATDPLVPAVIQGIVLVADRLELRTVAEGVETSEADLALRHLGVSDAQGYFYARPMPPEDAHRWARSAPRDHSA